MREIDYIYGSHLINKKSDKIIKNISEITDVRKKDYYTIIRSVFEETKKELERIFKIDLSDLSEDKIEFRDGADVFSIVYCKDLDKIIVYLHGKLDKVTIKYKLSTEILKRYFTKKNIKSFNNLTDLITLYYFVTVYLYKVYGEKYRKETNYAAMAYLAAIKAYINNAHKIIQYVEYDYKTIKNIKRYIEKYKSDPGDGARLYMIEYIKRIINIEIDFLFGILYKKIPNFRYIYEILQDRNCTFEEFAECVEILEEFTDKTYDIIKRIKRIKNKSLLSAYLDKASDYDVLQYIMITVLINYISILAHIFADKNNYYGKIEDYEIIDLILNGYLKNNHLDLKELNYFAKYWAGHIDEIPKEMLDTKLNIYMKKLLNMMLNKIDVEFKQTLEETVTKYKEFKKIKN